MLYLLQAEPVALYADWFATYGTGFYSYTLQDWRQGKHSSMSWLLMWQMVREILKNHRSHSYAALAGYSYIPTDADIILWALADNKDKRPPWMGMNQFGDRAIHASQAKQQEDRAKLQAAFNIKE